MKQTGTLLAACTVALLLVPSLGLCVPVSVVTVVDLIPFALSDEVHEDSEPNVTVDPANKKTLAASFFISGDDVCGQTSNMAPIMFSLDGGLSWFFKCDLQSVTKHLSVGTLDISLRFSGSANRLYVGFLRLQDPPPADLSQQLRLNIVRIDHPLSTISTLLVDRFGVDQPYVSAMTSDAATPTIKSEYVLVPSNSFRATIDFCFDSGGVVPWCGVVNGLESRNDARGYLRNDLAPVRVALHHDGTAYAVFFSRIAWNSILNSYGFVIADAPSDLVVVRQDHISPLNSLFDDLKDASDSLRGQRVVTNRTVHYDNLGNPGNGVRATYWKFSDSSRSEEQRHGVRSLGRHRWCVTA